MTDRHGNGAGSGGPARSYSWPPFEKGHTFSTKHGATSERRIRPLARNHRRRVLRRLRPWQKVVLVAMFPPDGTPSRWETFLISAVKKAGKTTLNAVATLYAALTFPAPETVYVVANDEAQATERVFELIADQVRRMG